MKLNTPQKKDTISKIRLARGGCWREGYVWFSNIRVFNEARLASERFLDPGSFDWKRGEVALLSPEGSHKRSASVY